MRVRVQMSVDVDDDQAEDLAAFAQQQGMTLCGWKPAAVVRQVLTQYGLMGLVMAKDARLEAVYTLSAAQEGEGT